MRILRLVILIFCGAILLSAGTLFAADSKPGWQATWEKTVAAAKKEGKLNFYVGRYGSEPLLNEFRKEFPEIRLVTVNGTGNSLGTRILTELRAGNVVADLFSGGANTNYDILYQGKALDSIKTTLILPEVLDESKWYEGHHRYTDPEQRHIFVYIANPSSSGFYYNTNLVKPKEFKSYWDLVAPKWKGKYVSQEPTSTGLGGGLQFMYYHPELGPEFIRRLFGDMQPTLGRDRRQITDWLAQGKYALCVGCRETAKAKSQGLPVDEFDDLQWKEGAQLTTGGGSMSLIKGAPNPNAARVFINWFLSRRGQIALQKYTDLYGEDPPNSRRVDIPKDMLPHGNRIIPGKRYFDVSDPKYADMTLMFNLIKEIMKAREERKD
ncbi:MAG TPA: extracellular solute-binding protein [Candidatus Binatia bacterium]|nr:extracellular solute-binding protein [Candidatus Binatia bacterium]